MAGSAVSVLILSCGSRAASSASERTPSLEAEWLAQYLRIDTSNPPGNEAPAADFLASLLTGAGIASERIATPSGRTSFVARLPATVANPAPSIVLLHHLDVVPAGEGWTGKPFAGEIHDGSLVGRGAIDSKSLGIAHVAALLDAARLPQRKRAILLVAVADEENGGVEGMGWIAAHRPELFDGIGAAFGEGGTNRTVLGRTFFWGVEVAQKRALWLELVARGRPGHGSSLNPESAAHTLLRALGRLVDRPTEWKLQPPVAAYLRGLGRIDPTLRAFADRPESAIGPNGPAPQFPAALSGLLLDTVQVTTLHASERTNVVAAEARATVDARLLPETDTESFLAGLKESLGNGIQVRVLLSSPPSKPSPADGEVWSVLEATLGREAPLLPAMIPGITDSRFFRERGIPAYGLSPFEIEGLLMRRVHGPDEEIPLAAFDGGVERMKRVLRALVAP